MKKLFTILLLTLSLFLFVGCGEKEPDWDKKTIANVEIPNNYSFEYDEYTIDMIKLLVTYTDGTSREVPLTQDMLSEKDYSKLQVASTPRVTVYYPNYDDFQFEINLNITLTDLGNLDLNLNNQELYGLVIKAIRNKEANKIDFIVEENVGFSGLQLQYTFNTELIQLSDITFSDKCSYTYGKVDGNKLSVSLVTKEVVEEETVLFSVAFDGNFRESELKINEEFDNQCFKLLEDFTTKTYNNVLYHVSKK